jgi:hypothetical protein
MGNSNLLGRNENQPGCAAITRPLRRSLELNAWLALTTATYVVALLLMKHHPDWSPGWKATLTLTPILPGLLYLRKGIQLLREMDELQRRIQFEAWLFAAFGTVIVNTVINVFNAQGLDVKWLEHGLEVGGTYLTMLILWSVGIVIANLRYR